MKEPTLISEGGSLVEHYEALRKEIVDFEGCSHRLHGLALLMRKGMAAWMKGVGEQAEGIAANIPTPAALPLPVGVEQHLIDILATMALATAWEGIT